MSISRTAITLLAAALILMFAGAASAREMAADETWSGVVRVSDEVVVAKGVRLTIQPGTRVVFDRGALCEEGVADTGIYVLGSLVADGTPDARITFTSSTDMPQPGDWGEIRIVGGADCSVSNCDFSYGGWGLHIHDTDVAVKGCTFRENTFGGIRGKGDKVEVAGCLFDGLDIGIRYWQGAPDIHHNEFTACGTAIFCRQDCDGVTIRQNNIVDSVEYCLKLGDGQKADIDASDNWWGTTDISKIREKIFDHGREEYIGRAIIEPVLGERVEIR